MEMEWQAQKGREIINLRKKEIFFPSEDMKASHHENKAAMQ